MRRLALVSFVLVAACGPGPKPVVQPPDAPPPVASYEPPPAVASSAPPPATAEPPPPPVVKADDADELLTPFAVDSRQPVRRVLFTWTTKAQAADLARSKKLLVKSAAPGADNLFEAALKRARDFGGAGARLGTLLSKPPFEKRRYAFANATGWALGPKGTPYGPVLVRMTLRDDAIVLVLGGEEQPLLRPFGALDMKGNVVKLDEIEAHPERVAVVFHAGLDGANNPFREYVVVNEGMLASWDVGTDEVAGELEREAQALERVAKTAPEEGRHNPGELAFAWVGSPRRPAAAGWHRLLGAGTDTYVFAKPNLEAVAKHLRGATRPDALTVSPDRPKAVKLPPPPPPPPTPPPPVRPPRKRPPIMI